MSAPAALLVHLPFDRDTQDASGGGHHAGVSGDATIARTQFQLGGGAAQLSGESNSCFIIPAYTPVVGNGARTVCFWMRANGVISNTPNAIFLGWGGATPSPGVRFDIALEDGVPDQLRAEFNTGRFLVSSNHANGLQNGKWHHVGVTYDGSVMCFFVDGRQIEEPRHVDPKLETGTCPAGTVIGTGVRAVMETAPHVRNYRGQIDDVAIWDVALSETEVRALYGLARIGDNNARWLATAMELWRKPVGDSIKINGRTWRKVDQLNGEAGEWVQIQGPNGSGSFIILGSNGRGLQIQYQWWEHGFVQLGGLIVAIFGVVAVVIWSVDRLKVRVRLRRWEAKERAEAERRRIARDLHDDLGSGLTEIMLLGDLAEKEQLSSEELRGRLAGITAKTRDMVAAVDEIVWTANPVNDVLPRLADYLADHAQRFLSAKGIRCRLDVGDSLPEVQVNARTRHHILMAVKEALNNAVKHSGATELWLRVHYEDNVLRLQIEDNGIGFDAQTVEGGNGLANLRARLEDVGGGTEIESQPGQGTCIRFTLRLQ